MAKNGKRREYTSKKISRLKVSFCDKIKSFFIIFDQFYFDGKNKNSGHNL